MLNGDASSHPFHSLPPPPPPPPHSHQTLFSSFGYHRLSPSSADEPRYGQGSSPLASCSRWISFFSFKVCIESFLSARPLSPLPWCVCTRVRAGVCKCVHVGACTCMQACACVCVHAGRRVRAGACTRACRRPPPLHAVSSAAVALWPTALPPAHPTLTTPVSLAARQGWRQHGAAGCPRSAHGPCSSAPPLVRACGDPQKHSPGSVPGGRAEQHGAQLGATGAGTLCSLPCRVFDTQRVALSGSGLRAQSGKGLRRRACFPGGCSQGWLSTGSAQLNPGDHPRGAGR